MPLDGGWGGCFNIESFVLLFQKQGLTIRKGVYMSDLSPYDFLDSGTPPNTNRGVGCTTQSTANALVDWLQVTFVGVLSPYRVIEFFELDNYFNFIEFHGEKNYRKGFISGGVSISFDGITDNMGVHLKLTGKGCRMIESIDTFTTWKRFFQQIQSFSEIWTMDKQKYKRLYNITRLDIAIDDFTGTFNIETLINKTEKGHWVSKFRTYKAIKSGKNDGVKTGATLYFGHAESDIQLRFYEKNEERKVNGFDYNVKDWNRTELQLRDDRALMMFKLIKDNSNDQWINIYKSVLNEYIRFVVPNKNDTNKRRWRIYKPWSNFINTLDKIKLTTDEIENDYNKFYDWFVNNMGPTLAIAKDIGMDLDKIVELGRDKFKDVHTQKIAKYKNDIKKEAQKDELR